MGLRQPQERISSPLAGEEGARARQGVGRRGDQHDLGALAKNLRRGSTDAERKLWGHLRSKRLNGAKFRRQEQIGDYIVDFVCFSRRLVIEVDGSQHFESAEDKARDAWLKLKGFEVLRFWNNDVLQNEDGVLAAILAALETPLPNPSPTRGEGL
ncbi:endonuclease domain-containing protein [Citromicrobium bathyomarinum]|uniref:endonuclease domain-containing protein n=1 Tax=Citromicrobium bathyomarinum TaxID=72174 RepID=UPI003159AFF4